MPRDLGYRAAGQRRQRRIEGLQYRERGSLGTRDDMTTGMFTKEDREGFHLRQFRHAYKSR